MDTKNLILDIVRQLLPDHSQVIYLKAWLASALSNEASHPHLEVLNVTSERHIRIAAKGALLGSLLDKGLNPEMAEQIHSSNNYFENNFTLPVMVILSDDAGQFVIILHAPCLIHAERLVHKSIAVNDLQHKTG